ncbi:MAG: hypothetical protein V4787_17395 [Pseudomonadota bacterium]
MNHAIAPGITPPPRGLEREEPEIGQEDDIPSDDDHGTARSPSDDGQARDVERE